MPWENPKIDWVTNPKNPRSEDLNRIEGNIAFLKQDIETKKGSIVDALALVGLPVTIEDSYEDISSEVINSNKGAVNGTITTQNGKYTIPKGYHDGAGQITALFANLIATNVRDGVNIGGVIGTLVQGSRVVTGTATSVSGSDGYQITVTGLPFKPRYVMFYERSRSTTNQAWFGVLMDASNWNTSTSTGYGVICRDSATSSGLQVNKVSYYPMTASGFFIGPSGLNLNRNTTITYIAIE